MIKSLTSYIAWATSLVTISGPTKSLTPFAGAVSLLKDPLTPLLVHVSPADPDSFRVEFLRFDYEVELSARALEASPLPAEFADMLRKAH
jgi:hypothetical protein